MIRLAKSEVLQRKIRQDDPVDLATPTWSLVREATQTGRINEALELVEYGLAENQAIHDALASFVDDNLSYIARFGEEELEKFLRQKYYDRVKNWLSVTPGLEESLQRFSEYQRSHFSNFTVVEEPDRYVVRYDPCGTGGRLMRTKNVARTQKAYPWSWGKSGISYYCTHCCVAWEIIPIELRGYPLRIHLIAEKPEDPCIHLYYKRPELIPEEYFTRVGKTKTIK